MDCFKPFSVIPWGFRLILDGFRTAWDVPDSAGCDKRVDGRRGLGEECEGVNEGPAWLAEVFGGWGGVDVRTG